ncbi:hypothetical protein H6F44_18170 [Pseudanabaena sp. FACHB-1277]|jgi:heme-degrading monooxygenase HmoA|uniref:ABM domain-containing protein n=1 Tax=Pseudanabaena cinerea FACHB-1277 TaxID=2949581 RepID=A0A926Z7S6_9CYAN|nr:hypothetical protein [Pseudanabaena cinerea]MBD2152032.1 hypothetical protein [Pseudanabaena cinerea FACHB-1277]
MRNQQLSLQARGLSIFVELVRTCSMAWVNWLKLLVTCSLACVILLNFAMPVQAGKFMSSLAFESTDDIVEVAAIYESSYATQKTLVKSLKVSNKPMKKALGFKGFALLQSQNGNKVIALSQWQDLDSYEAYMPSASGAKSKNSETASAIPAPTQTLIYEIVSAQTAIAGAKPALRGKEAVVRWTHLTPKNIAINTATNIADSEMRSSLLDQVSEIVPSLLASQPIPQSVILLKGIDSDDITIMSNWNCSAMFEDVGKPEAITLDEDLIALADSDDTIYDVITLIPAPVKKQKAIAN